jgi:hypothetical protein
MGICSSRTTNTKGSENSLQLKNVPRLDFTNISPDDYAANSEEVPYKDNWLKGSIDKVEGDVLHANVYFGDSNVRMKVRPSNGSVEGIEPGEIMVKPVRWGRKTSIIAEVISEKSQYFKPLFY